MRACAREKTTETLQTTGKIVDTLSEPKSVFFLRFHKYYFETIENRQAV